MKDGMIVQFGRYNYLLDSGLDFIALVAAHDTSMELVEMGTTMPSQICLCMYAYSWLAFYLDLQVTVESQAYHKSCFKCSHGAK